jgi:hypothetical protein
VILRFVGANPRPRTAQILATLATLLAFQNAVTQSLYVIKAGSLTGSLGSLRIGTGQFRFCWQDWLLSLLVKGFSQFLSKMVL